MPEDIARNGLPLTYGQFTVGLVPEASLALPAYAGSMFRGAFGSALQQVVCVTRTYDCPPCVLKERCLYPYVFETPPPPSSRIMRKYTAAPHPFVFEPPVGGITVPAAQPLALGLTLFGKTLGYISHFIFALERLGQRGLGGRRVRCSLSCVQSRLDGRDWVLYAAEDRTPRSVGPFEKSITLPLHPPALLRGETPNERLAIELLTPLRVIYEARLLTTNLPFHVLVRNLLRRIAHLSYFHCGGDPSAVAFKEWIELAGSVRTVHQDLKWFDWERYSSRQRTTMRLGGLVGRVTFEGGLAPFRPLLAAGEVTHAGKGTSFGLGRYRMVSWGAL
jgi:hypothetical protein